MRVWLFPWDILGPGIPIREMPVSTPQHTRPSLISIIHIEGLQALIRGLTPTADKRSPQTRLPPQQATVCLGTHRSQESCFEYAGPHCSDADHSRLTCVVWV